MITIFFIFLSIVTAFVMGRLSTKKQDTKCVCPFQHACLEYNEIETKAAIKRILTTMINADVPEKEIRNLVDKSL